MMSIYTILWIYTHICEIITTIKILNVSFTTKFLCVLCNPFFPSPPLPILRQPLICCLSLWISLHFLDHYINGSWRFVLSFCIMIWHSSMLSSDRIICSFYCWVIIVWIYRNLFIRSRVDGHLGFVQILTEMNKTAINIQV